MTEQEWLQATDSKPMLEFLSGKASDRKLILFILACAYRNPQTLVDAKHHKLYRSWERYVEGLTSLDEVNGVYEAFTQGRDDEAPKPYDLAVWDAYAFASIARDRRAEVNAQIATLHDLFSPLPFRPITIDPTWLTWHDGLLISMARRMYDSRDFSDMPVLADALEEAGCTNPDVLSHCRQPSEHVRGCFVLDLLLNRE